MDLSHFRSQIDSLEPLNQSVKFNAAHWRVYNFENEEISNGINLLISRHQDSISRQDIIDYLGKDDSSLLIGFLMTMIWGHGYTANNRADNRGPWKVGKMLEDFEQSMAILEIAKDSLMINDIQSAHSAFNDMPRCRVNFFSKFLYFLGKGLGMENYPLIFDARVASTLGRQNSIDPDIFSIIETTPKQDAVSYENYIKVIHSEAQKMGVEADKIEYFLYLGI